MKLCMPDDDFDDDDDESPATDGRVACPNCGDRVPSYYLTPDGEFCFDCARAPKPWE